LHHVRDLPTHIVYYDWVFLIVSGGLVLLGLAVRDGRGRAAAPLMERRDGSERRIRGQSPIS
jgi:hypothetical protein